jgi:hypothetical protein
VHQDLLPFEQRQRHVVTVLVGELGEPDDVGEHDRAAVRHPSPLDARLTC